MDIRPTYDNLKSVMSDFCNDVRDNYRSLLEADGRKASGNLINNIDYRIDETETGFDIYLILEDYWAEIEYGRNPTRNGGNGEVRLKIADWIRQKGLPTGDGTDLPTEEQLSFLIARKIHTFGFEGGEYLKKTLDVVIPEYDRRLQEALMKDFEESIVSQITGAINNINIG